MRSLTEAEARVICVQLAGVPGPERRSVRDAGVPRTTYQTIRHRAFAKGWLRERYIPHPNLFDTARIRFIAAQPYAERWNDSVRALRLLDGLVVLWASPETLFGVVFERLSSRGWENIRSADPFRRYWTVAPENRGDGILAYFDYEGAWSRWTLDREPIAYPQAFQNLVLPASPISRTDWKAVRGLLIRPFNPGPSQSGPMMFSSSRLSRHERRLLAEGWVSHRVLPDFSEIPPLRGYRPDRVVFITALVRSGRSPQDLFVNLARRARVAPFLYVYDKERVLLLALSPAPLRIAQSRVSVVDVLQEHLEKIEVVRES
ncbi:MAG: hypothetical protein WA549_04545, partial [Thermoplasmata archaeon]